MRVTDETMTRFLSLRERYSGTIQDILAGLSLMAFIIMAGLYLEAMV